ncbi:virulence protein [Erwinia typographi]|uniref:Virulence protein n=1 Tax=Erwinia typographi TaxID=371042 RepID=A0A0A3ZLW3_9GAMM|nr:Ail/Lom family outer membrane beta-barrel protein [Erwinia typographi]KGT86738.1 virulence protein [Erwinia typographi]
MKLTISALLLTSVVLSPLACASNHTVTLGYAQSKMQDFKDIKGANLKYRYEWDSPLSVIGSLTYMTGKEDYHDNENVGTNATLDVNSKVKYYSLSAGPAYRINNYISVYGLVGVNYTKADDNAVWKYKGEAFQKDDYSGNTTSLMYGAGIQINPIENIAIDLGYEGTRVKFGDQSYSVNGFNIGVGYRF